ncbi:DUF4870 family protein [Halomonas alkalicola]|jgi:uncharacterized membrane protein|uniref:DUF4345 domain-containing protein n=1 Tax=Halomonas alkalicola TaxID=1930622 RepID=A0ABY9H196_9GAMM|nr:hypothetical protein [Halomonas alkalicola]WLI72246.1 hypothetical protein B6N23_10585 [Halomonas alkalicola]
MSHTDTTLAPDTRGRGLAAAIYVLYLGSIMAVITAPIGVVIAHIRRGRVPPMADSHLLFQIRTFWLGALGGAIALAAWNLLGWIGAPAWASWVLGYGFFTACLIWTIARCGVGIQRLMAARPVDNPRSLLFGGAAVRLGD